MCNAKRSTYLGWRICVLPDVYRLLGNHMQNLDNPVQQHTRYCECRATHMKERLTALFPAPFQLYVARCHHA
jgi:hypothetical protein